MELDVQHLFMSFDGRINRAKFWVGAIGFLIVWMVIEAIFGFTVFGRILKFLAVVGLFYPAYALAAKRFQDRDRPGATALYGLVPALMALLFGIFGFTGDLAEPNALGWICRLVIWGVGLWFVIELGILKGTPGPNRFGGDPLAAVR
jgi:uncharacterized membrane protein YhaH (DUF805 family)